MMVGGESVQRKWLIVMLFLAAVGRVLGDTYTWTNTAGTGDWFAVANWTNEAGLNGSPGPGDAALVNPGAMILLTNETPYLQSFTMSGGTLVFTNWMTRLQAGDVILNGGFFTLPGSFTTNSMSNRVWVVCTNFTLGPGGTINVDKMGYAPGNGIGGRAVSVGTVPGAGAGHGGEGGLTSLGITGGVSYGFADVPQTPGSGSGPTQNKPGNSGGGVVRIDAGGAVLLSGTITADGDNTNGFYSIGRSAGGGAGGSIWISCATLAGSGVVSADGADGWAAWTDPDTLHHASGGGGGGRIAVHYDKTLQAAMPLPSIRFTANPGRGQGYHPMNIPPSYAVDVAHFTRAMEADWGTLYFSDASGVARIPDTIGNVSGHLVFGSGPTNFTIGALALTNTAFGIDSTVAVTVTGSLSVATGAAWIARSPLSLSVNGNVTIRGEMRFDAATDFRCKGDLFVGPTGTFSIAKRSIVNVGGGIQVSGRWANILWQGVDATVSNDVVLFGKSWLSAQGLSTNGSSGDAAMRLSVLGDIQMESNTWVYVYADAQVGGAPSIQCRNLTVPEGAGFQADARGYEMTRGTSGPTNGGLGPGQGVPNSLLSAGGGGYGGRGGASSAGKAGGTNYGVAWWPVHAGSGGGRTSSSDGGKGGGLISLRVRDTLRLDGTLTANGGAGSSYLSDRNGGGGAGGGIRLVTDVLQGGSNATLYACGGMGPVISTNGGGGGGGGRIAVWTRVKDQQYAKLVAGNFSGFETNSRPPGYAGTWSVTGGSGWVAGGDGSVYFGTVPVDRLGACLLFR